MGRGGVSGGVVALACEARELFNSPTLIDREGGGFVTAGFGDVGASLSESEERRLQEEYRNRVREFDQIESDLRIPACLLAMPFWLFRAFRSVGLHGRRWSVADQADLRTLYRTSGRGRARCGDVLVTPEER